MSEFTEIDMEYILDAHNLQLIIVEAMNKTMSHRILSLKSANQMWDAVEALIEGFEKVMATGRIC